MPAGNESTFASTQTVRWCPGCGDYAILKSLQKVFARLNMAHENIVVVSGIGCAGRMPYYLNTYGFHGVHGRAVAIATGLKLTRPELSVWVITGDGDSLSIGANHLLHGLRRDVDINIVCVNNRVYGLTKGQCSPTSAMGQTSPTSPDGMRHQPVCPVRFALAAGAGFVARSLDIDASHLQATLLAAARHPGAAFVEVYQNCPVFNEAAFANVRDKTQRAHNALWLNPDEPLCFGANQQCGLQLVDDVLRVVQCHTPGALAALAVHRPNAVSLIPAMRLTELCAPGSPVPLGIFREVVAPQAPQPERMTLDAQGLSTLMRQGQCWTVG